jgi:hypothetical protein
MVLRLRKIVMGVSESIYRDNLSKGRSYFECQHKQVK